MPVDLDELTISEVSPVALGGESSFQQWPCGSCGRWHPTGEGYAIRYHENGFRRHLFVCRDCAAPYVR